MWNRSARASPARPTRKTPEMSLTPDQLRELEAGEAWLARQPQPRPDAKFIAALKSRVADAARRQTPAASPRSMSHGRAAERSALGALAAAAMLLLSAGIVWNAAREYHPSVIAPTAVADHPRGGSKRISASDDELVERFADAAGALESEDPGYQALDSALQAVENGLAMADDSSPDQLLSDVNRLSIDIDPWEGL